MINEARPYASLSSGLLARKGAAKPAMRPQGFAHIEDLGWNDMGYTPAPDEQEHEPAAAEHVPSSIAALTPSPKPVDTAETDEPEVVAQQRVIAESFEAEPVEAEAEPEVVAQQRVIAESFEAEPVEAEAEPEAAPADRREPAEIVSLPQRVATVAPGKKAAFTLRLDPERHLRLRLACAVTGRSAQQIVVDALDRALAAIPEIEALAERVPAKTGTRGAKRS